MDFPLPSKSAQAHSLDFQHYLKKIIRSEKKISFHDFMKEVLYHPGLGYYSAGSHKLGAEGDFVTAPEISSLFGQSIAHYILENWPNKLTYNYLELGAGSGKLAADLLNYVHEKNKLPQNYFILEVSADLKERQKKFLRQHLPEVVFEKLIWLDAMPDSFSGIIIANEVLDALPVHRFQKNHSGIQEYFISLNEDDSFQEILSEPSSAYLKERILSLNLDVPYTSEINLQQEALLKSLASSLQEGVMIFIDYGFPQKEFYHPDRQQGTLMCHYRHRAHQDIFFWPGLQDITAHIDFTALAATALSAGLNVAAFATQSSFLLQAKILELAMDHNKKLDLKEQILQKQAVHQLIAPEKMGELFKVIIFTKKIKWSNLAQGEMLHRL